MQIIQSVERIMSKHRRDSFVAELLAITFEEEARSVIRDFHNHADPDPFAMENYTALFLTDYGRALNWKYTDRHCFLDAYAHRELAVINGASEDELDRLAYELRQEWAERTRKVSGSL